MKAFKSFATPALIAVLLGLGFGFGVAAPAEASLQSCRAACAGVMRECRAEGNDFFFCRGLYSSCLRTC